MKIIVIKDIPSQVFQIKEGDTFDVITKLEPDKWNKQARYIVKYGLGNIKLPEEFVKEIVN